MNLNWAPGTASAIRRGEMRAVYAKYNLVLTPRYSSDLRTNQCSEESGGIRPNLPITRRESVPHR